MAENNKFSNPAKSSGRFAPNGRRSVSSGSLPTEKVNRGRNSRMEEKYLFSIKERAEAKLALIPFVAVQDVPHRITQDPVNLNSDHARLFDDARIAVLKEQKPS
jgi:hypothetical protein